MQLLVEKVNVAIKATLSRYANPGPQRGISPEAHPQETEFVFNDVKFVGAFTDDLEGINAYYSDSSRVLFLPRNPNEQYIDAAVFDFSAKRAIAIQVCEALCALSVSFLRTASVEQVTGQHVMDQK